VVLAFTIYRPDERVDPESAKSAGTSNKRALGDNSMIRHSEHKRHPRVLVNGTNRSQKPHNLVFGSVYAEGLDHKSIQRFEIDLGDRRVCAGRYSIDKALKRVLGNDNLINYSWIG
jgi:hypothetical protein